MNRGGIADLPLLRTLLATRQKSREPSFREVDLIGLDWKALFHVKKIVEKKNQINECIIKNFLK